MPFVRGDLTAAAADSTTALQGACCRHPAASRSAPVWTSTPSRSASRQVDRPTVTVKVTAPRTRKLQRRAARLSSCPAGWTVERRRATSGSCKAGRSATRTFEVTAAGDAATNQRVLVIGGAVSSRRHGAVTATPSSRSCRRCAGDQELLPQVVDFQQYAQSTTAIRRWRAS